MNRLPVWDSSHSRFSVSKLFTEGSVLGLRVSTPVWVVEGNVQEKGSVLASTRNAASSRIRFSFVSLEELPDKKFDPGDVPPHLQHRGVFFCVGKVKRIDRTGPDVLLPDYTCGVKENRW